MARLALALLFLVATTDAFSCVPTNDPVVCSALGDLYNSTNGPGWVNDEGWAPAAAGYITDYCTFYGPSCDGFGRLFSLQLNNNQLSGPIPGSIGSLTNLQTLYVVNNQLSGPIPDSIGSLTNLQQLGLGYNQLSGPVPGSIGSLTNLQILNLGFNQLSGPTPGSIGSLTNLLYLNLGFNQLSGPIPDSIGSLTKLQGLDLSTNQLSGPIPGSIGSLTNLQTLYVVNNLLSGPIPDSIVSLTNLQGLYSGNNQLSGPIPRSIGSLTNLNSLDLENNLLSGPIPDTIGSLTNLFYLGLGQNKLSGPIPESIGSLANLQILALGFNQLSGPIPDSIGSLANLQQLDLENNLLDGPVPGSIGGLTNLNYLDLDTNQLSGPIPWSIGSLTNLNSLDVHSNQLSGTVPVQMASLTSLTSLGLSFNLFTGALPSFLLAAPYNTFISNGNRVQPTATQTVGQAIAVCAAGSYLVGVDTSASSYFPAPVCSLCPSGTFSASAGATACTLNPPGYVNVNGSVVLPCPPGTFLENNKCTVCAPGTYAPANASTSCQLVPPGSVSTANSTSYTACPAGTFLNASLIAGAACQRCAPGLYAPSEASTACQLVPAGSYSANNSSSYITCAAGTFLNATSWSCQGCAPGSFSSDAAITCSPCPAGYVSPASASACTPCLAGTFRNGTSCQSCAPGLYVPSEASISCLLVPPGSVSTADGTSYTACPAGTFLNGASCQPCASGSSSLIGSAACTPAPPGRLGVYTVNASFILLGTTLNSSLTTAIATFLGLSPRDVFLFPEPGRRRLLAAATITLSVLTADIGATLAAVKSPAFNATLASVKGVLLTAAPVVTGLSFIPACTDGYFQNTTSQACQPCQAGTVAAAGATSCTLCLGSSYADVTTCLPCPAGATSPPLSVSMSSCTCPAGYSVVAATNGTCAASASAGVSSATLGGILGGVLGFVALVAAASVLLVRRELRRRAAVAAATAAAASRWKAVVTKEGEIALGTQLGSGGFGTVYCATWKGTLVAVKVLSASRAVSLVTPVVPAANTRRPFPFQLFFATQDSASSIGSDALDVADPALAREVEFLSQLRHPNILAVYAVQLKPQTMLVMELGTGGSLGGLLACTSLFTFNWLQRVTLGVGVASGMEFLHSQNPPIIHLDMKSANVVLDSTLTPKICDFGMSEFGATKGGKITRFTPAYCAPEVALKFVVTNFPAVDVYGFGCILHDLAHIGTGVAKEEEHSVDFNQTHTLTVDVGLKRVLIKRRMLDFKPCIAAGVPDALASLLLALLAVDPGLRPTAEGGRTGLAGLAATSVTWVMGSRAEASAGSVVPVERRH